MTIILLRFRAFLFILALQMTLSMILKIRCEALQLPSHGRMQEAWSLAQLLATKTKPSKRLSSSNDSSNNAAAVGETLKTLAKGSFMAEMEVKKSRFIGYASHVNSWDEAKSYLEQIKSEHPKARHWCFGFCGGHNPVNERCSDDGEPSGTAGAPILNAIRGEGLSDTVCVVVRYFGGVKLGAGGLIRAYGAAARQVLREAPLEILIPTTSLNVTVGTEHIGTVYELVGKVQGTVGSEEYGADGSLTLRITCEASNEDRLRASLRDATKGSAILS